MSSLTPIQQVQARQPASFSYYRPSSDSRYADESLTVWKERRSQAKRDRARYEPDWYLCQAYVANKQWIGWSERLGRVLSLLSDPREKYREHHTENVITTYLWTAIGGLGASSLLPPLFYRREDLQSRKVAEEARYIVKYAWDEELLADEVLEDILLKLGTYGTGAAQLGFYRGSGASYGEYPVGEDGRMIVDKVKAMQYVSDLAERGQTTDYQELRGQLRLDALGPFNMLVPPGVPLAKNMPWIIIEKARPVSALRSEYPDRADEIQAQSLAAVDMIGLRAVSSDGDNANTGRLHDHAMEACGYEMATKEFPKGRYVKWTGDTLLEEVRQLPYLMNERWYAGIVPYHYRRVDGRFWGLGLVEPAIGVQRQRNRARSQHIEMKDRNLGRVYADKGTITQSNLPQGRIMELIELLPGSRNPLETSGVAPGPWISEEVRMLDEAMDRVTGVSALSALSQAPPSVSAYAALALMKEQDDRRNGPIMRGIRRSTVLLTKMIVHAIRDYWPPGKEVSYRGPSGEFGVFVYEQAKLDPDVYIEYSDEPGLPESPASQVQLTFDLFDRSVSSGQPLPLQWLYESVTGGKLRPLPHQYNDLQNDKAEYENMLIEQGVEPPVAPYDNDELHVRIHREGEEMQALQPGKEQLVALFEMHIQQHLMSAEQKAIQAQSLPNAQGGYGALGGQTSPGQPQPATPGVQNGSGPGR